MRDFWYDVVSEKFPTGKDRTELNDKIVELQRGEVSRDEVIVELQRQVDELAKNLKDSTNGESTTASIQNIANDIVTATRLGDRVYANVHCRKCNSYTGMLVGVDHCPGCGTPLS
jgi:hypothetical protein